MTDSKSKETFAQCCEENASNYATIARQMSTPEAQGYYQKQADDWQAKADAARSSNA